MRRSWNDIRAKAAAFAREWAGAQRENSEKQVFYQQFFEIFGIPVRRVATFEEPVKKLGDRQGYIDLFWKGVLLVEQKSAGGNLNAAKEQAFEYIDGLPAYETPRYLLLSDFKSFELYDLEQDERFDFTLAELPKHVEKFGFIIGVQRRKFEDQDPVNIKAAELIGALYDALKAANYDEDDLPKFLVRLVFCLFADNTGVFSEPNMFFEFLNERTRPDGSDLGPLLATLFQILDKPEDARPAAEYEELVRFPYVDGALFHDTLEIPSFDRDMRLQLLAACRFDWSKVSPAIFGSLFQSVMDPKKRRNLGAHYTSEKNILKLIGPLFLDSLRAEFEKLKARRGGRRVQDLRAFHQKLGTLKFLDPACGCGNFLVIAYRELRKLEIEVIRTRMKFEKISGVGALFGGTDLLRLDVDQFYGIELEEFPARIAETALWMMDHIMNNELSLEFGASYTRIPLKKSPHIRCADALEMDWAKLLPPEACSYVFGNPPFGGSKVQSKEQRLQVRCIANLGKCGGTLDFVTAWFIKAGRYIEAAPKNTRIAFVATSSITQGEQVAQLWPLLFEQCRLELTFAHQTFSWSSDARGMAHVHVVILGLCKRDAAPPSRRLFSYSDIKGEPHESSAKLLSPYLFDAGELRNPRIVVSEVACPINGLPKMVIGSQPIDDKRYIFDVEQRKKFLRDEPGAKKFMRPYVGAKEFLQKQKRWILSLQNATPTELQSMPKVVARMRDVRNFRSKSLRKSTLDIAEYPERYNIETLPKNSFLFVPGVSSERRAYAPIGWLHPPVIPSNAAFAVVEGATVPLFGLLTSAMHMAWLRYVGGRLESRYRYSIGLVYNTFPLPPNWKKRAARLDAPAQAVLDARAAWPDETLANLYHPDRMPTGLRKAHAKLDRTVDRLYRRSGFESETDRIAHLFSLYEKMLAPLTAPKPRRKRRR